MSGHAYEDIKKYTTYQFNNFVKATVESKKNNDIKDFISIRNGQSEKEDAENWLNILEGKTNKVKRDNSFIDKYAT